jgi:tetratricopeptide (TPR) repeat protein
VAQVVSRVIVFARAVGLLLVIVATGYALHRWALRPLRCGYAASVGAATLDRKLQSDYQTRRLAGQIRADLEDCTCVSPPDARITMTLGAAAEAIDDTHTAITEYQRALLIDRRPEIYFHLGLTQQETPDRAAAIDSIVRACAFDPARLADIPYDDVRREAEQRLRATYGPDWVR